MRARVRWPVLAWVVLVGALSASAESPRVVEPGSAPDLLNESILFFAGFDRDSPTADLAAGRADPLRVEGTPRYVRGRFGRAVVLGAGGDGVRLTYASEAQLDLRRPGALSFWSKPVAWLDTREPSRGYVKFVTVPARPGSFVVERMGFDRRKRRGDRLIVGVFDLPRTERLHVQIKGTEQWSTAEWHLVVVNWDRYGIEVSLDGRPFEQRAAPEGFQADAFVRGKVHAPFVIGDAGSETSAIDEFTLYARPLAPAEVSRLYGTRETKKDAKPAE